jgi:hypothetical protein
VETSGQSEPPPSINDVPKFPEPPTDAPETEAATDVNDPEVATANFEAANSQPKSSSIRFDKLTLNQRVTIDFNSTTCENLTILSNKRIKYLKLQGPIADHRIEFAAHRKRTLLELSSQDNDQLNATFATRKTSLLPKIEINGAPIKNIIWYKYQKPNSNERQILIPVIRENQWQIKEKETIETKGRQVIQATGWGIISEKHKWNVGEPIVLKSEFLFVEKMNQTIQPELCDAPSGKSTPESPPEQVSPPTQIAEPPNELPALPPAGPKEPQNLSQTTMINQDSGTLAQGVSDPQPPKKPKETQESEDKSEHPDEHKELPEKPDEEESKSPKGDVSNLTFNYPLSQKKHVIIDFESVKAEHVVIAKSMFVEHLEITKVKEKRLMEFATDPNKTLLEIKEIPRNVVMLFVARNNSRLPMLKINNVDLADVKWYKTKGILGGTLLIPVISNVIKREWTAIESDSAWNSGEYVYLNSNYLLAPAS